MRGKKTRLNFVKSILLIVVAVSCMLMIDVKAEAADYYAFINDSRGYWKNGASWGRSQKPRISSWPSSGCCAYCADFVKYVYGLDTIVGNSQYTSTSSIAAGDILHLYGNQGQDEHWIVVLGRNGNSLTTAEGSYCSTSVKVSSTRYTISGQNLNYIGDDAGNWYSYRLDFGRKFSGGSTPSTPTDPTPGTRNYFSDISGYAKGDTTAYIEAYTINSEYPTEVGYFIGTDANNMTRVRENNGGKETKKIFYNLSGLKPGTTYYYQIYAISGGQIFYTYKKTFTTTGSRFRYSVDSFTCAPGEINISGWLLDNANWSNYTSVNLHIGDDFIANYPVNATRTDVGNAYPGAGNNRGFSIHYPSAYEGNYEVRIYAISSTGDGAVALMASKNMALKKRFKSNLDEITAKPGALYIRGWVQDVTNTSAKPTVIVTVDDKEVARFTANVSRSDKLPGYDRNIISNLTGSHTVKLYAINPSDNINHLLTQKTVTFKANNKPKVSNAKVSNITANGYTVSCTVTDDTSDAIDHVTFKTKVGNSAWVSKNGTVSGSTATINVSTKDFGGVGGTYTTEIYAYDKNGAVSDVQRVTANVTVGHTGLADGKDGNWYLYNNGVINTGYSGLYCDSTYGWWLVLKGRIAFEYNDLYCDSKIGWWKVQNGALDLGYTDLYYSPTLGWWKVKGGALDIGYTDLYCSPTYGWWKVKSGQLDVNYTDLYYSPTLGWWKIYGGALDYVYTDLYYSPTMGWWKVNGGQVDLGYTDLYCSPTLGWWKVNGGTLDLGYTDFYYSPTIGWWKVNGGQVDIGFNGLYFSQTLGWRKVISGTVDWNYTGVYNDPAVGAWYIFASQIDFNYNGYVTTGGIIYQVTGGRAVPIAYAAKPEGLRDEAVPETEPAKPVIDGPEVLEPEEPELEEPKVPVIDEPGDSADDELDNPVVDSDGEPETESELMDA